MDWIVFPLISPVISRLQPPVAFSFSSYSLNPQTQANSPCGQTQFKVKEEFPSRISSDRDPTAARLCWQSAENQYSNIETEEAAICEAQGTRGICVFAPGSHACQPILGQSGLFSRVTVQQTSEVKDTMSPAQPWPFSVWPHPHTTTMGQPGTCLKL